MRQSVSAIEARQRKLLELLQEHENMAVPEASEKLGVSEVTIRRDLTYFEKMGFIKRSYGKIQILTAQFPHETQVKYKLHQNEWEKEQIGRYTASLVNDRDTVFLNSGTTTLYVMKYLNDKKVKIITNNALAPTAIWSEKPELIMTGGECRIQSKSLVGMFAQNTISNVYADFCILGANGITDQGVTTSVYTETPINIEMVKHCNGKVIIVADGRKVGKSFDFFSVAANDIDLLITDSTADAEELRGIEQAGIAVHQVERKQESEPVESA